MGTAVRYNLSCILAEQWRKVWIISFDALFPFYPLNQNQFNPNMPFHVGVIFIYMSIKSAKIKWHCIIVQGWHIKEADSVVCMIIFLHLVALSPALFPHPCGLDAILTSVPISSVQGHSVYLGLLWTPFAHTQIHLSCLIRYYRHIPANNTETDINKVIDPKPLNIPLIEKNRHMMVYDVLLGSFSFNSP